MKNAIKLSLIIPTLLLTGCLSSKTNNDPQNYSEYLKIAVGNSDFHSELYIFPQDITEEEIKTFAYQTMDGLFTGSYFLYVVAQYDQTIFEAEINRLDDIKATFKNGKVKSILKYEEQSLYLTLNKDNRYEYVKYSKDTFEIAYVSNQLYKWNEVDINDNHLLGEVVIPQELDDGNNSYNMYYSYEGDIGYYVND